MQLWKLKSSASTVRSWKLDWKGCDGAIRGRESSRLGWTHLATGLTALRSNQYRLVCGWPQTERILWPTVCAGVGEMICLLFLMECFCLAWDYVSSSRIFPVPFDTATTATTRQVHIEIAGLGECRINNGQPGPVDPPIRRASSTGNISKSWHLGLAPKANETMVSESSANGRTAPFALRRRWIPFPDL